MLQIIGIVLRILAIVFYFRFYAFFIINVLHVKSGLKCSTCSWGLVDAELKKL